MFAFCDDPATLETFRWFACYLTNGRHLLFYQSFGTVLLLLAITAPLALAFGFAGASASRSRVAPLRWIGRIYTAMVRGIPDIAFFLFFVIALDQGIEFLRHQIACPDWTDPIRQGANFLVCDAARTPPNSAAQWVHETYNFALAVFTYALVFGAFAANVLGGAMAAVPHAQLETAEAFGMGRTQVFWRVLVPQMWIYALPGLSNLWLILIKATPLLFLLGVEEIVYWARELGATRLPGPGRAYPHPDWVMWYFLALLIFYLGMTRVSEVVLGRLTRRLSRGQAMAQGLAEAPCPMTCLETLQAYGLRALGIGERRLPQGDITLCEQVVLIGSGMIWNVYFAIIALALGFVFALALAVGKAARPWILRKPAEAFIFLFRGSPLFIQFFFAYFAFVRLPDIGVDLNLGFVELTAETRWFARAWLGALIVLWLNTSAYTAEIFYGALRSVPKGDLEAADAYGLSGWSRFRRIVFPTTMRLAWPAYTNEAIFLFHATTLVFFSGFPALRQQGDALYYASYFADRTFNPFIPYPIVAVYFVIFTLAIIAIFGLINRRLNAHLPQAARRRLRYRPQLIR